MKQKIVIKVSQKSPSKALKIAVGVSGVESVAFLGDDRSQIVVTGDGVDAVVLTTLLKKKVRYAELVSVGAAGDQNEDENVTEVKPVMWPNYYVGVPYYNVHVIRDHDPYNCSIL